MGGRDQICDVAIAGGGPAGSSLAIRLARAGLDVILIEKETFPRGKLCGEFISPECLEYFDELGILPSMRLAGGIDVRRTVFYSRGGRPLEIPSDWFGTKHSMAMGLTRAEMDFHLLSEAKRAGAETLQNTKVIRLAKTADAVTGIVTKAADSTEFTISARLLVDATGRQQALGRMLGERPPKATSVAFKAHVAGSLVPADNCEIYSYTGGYGGCSPVENGLHNLCFITNAADAKQASGDPEKVFRNKVLANRRAAEVLDSCQIAGPWHAVPITRYGRTKLVLADGVISVGDAAAFIDPFTGSGILLALQSAKVAASAIVEGLFARRDGFAAFAADYERRYAASLAARMRVSSAILNITRRSWVADAVIFALSQSSILRRQLARATRSTS